MSQAPQDKNPRPRRVPALLSAKALGAVVIATAALAGCGPVAGGVAKGGTSAAAHPADAASAGPSSGGDPQLAGVPHIAAMPAHGASTTAKPSPAKASGTRAAGTGTGQAPSQGNTQAQSPSPASSSASGSGQAACAHPQYVTSDQNGMWNLSPYFVANDMWNVSGYNVSQTLSACSFSNWYVTATMDNSKGDGAVKTFPNSHRDFDNSPRVSSFKSITSTFADTGPASGIYEDAYDIWLNGIGGSSSTEVMIWTSNHGQTPSGTTQGTVTIGGMSYTAWKTAGDYIAFVANANFASGSVNLLAFFQWLMSKGWIGGDATLAQVDYGVELVSTNGVPATFAFTGFTINAS